MGPQETFTNHLYPQSSTSKHSNQQQWSLPTRSLPTVTLWEGLFLEQSHSGKHKNELFCRVSFLSHLLENDTNCELLLFQRFHGAHRAWVGLMVCTGDPLGLRMEPVWSRAPSNLMGGSAEGMTLRHPHFKSLRIRTLLESPAHPSSAGALRSRGAPLGVTLRAPRDGDQDSPLT